MLSQKTRRPRRIASSTDVRLRVVSWRRRYITEAMAFRSVSLGRWRLFSAAEVMVEQNLVRYVQAWIRSALIPIWMSCWDIFLDVE